MRKFNLSLPYNQENILETVNKLHIEQKGLTVITTFDNHGVATTNVSDKYEAFDFPAFAKNILGEIENYFLPEKYSLSITKGVQELRLIGEEVLINGDVYHKMFNLLNSTDKSRALQLNIGLIRFICTNGMVVAKEDEYSGFKTKHFKLTMTDKVSDFISKLDTFEMNINKQCETIEQLQGKFLSFQDIAKNIVLEKNEEGEFTNLMKSTFTLKLRAFAKKLMDSKTDCLDTNLLHAEQIHLLKNPLKFLEHPNVDIEIPAYTALNCYTEIFRNYDSSVIKRETNRILQLC